MNIIQSVFYTHFLTYLIFITCQAIQNEDQLQETSASNTDKMDSSTYQETKNETVEFDRDAMQKYRMRKSSASTFSLDFSKPDWNTLRAQIGEELASQNQPTTFTINIKPKPQSTREDFLILVKFIDDFIKKLVQPNQTIKYLAKPIGKKDKLKKLRLKIEVKEAKDELKNEYDLLEKIAKEQILNKLKALYKKMNFKFESFFNAIDTTKKNEKNTARLVFLVYNRNWRRIGGKTLKELMKEIMKKHPQFVFKSAFVSSNPKVEYLILNFKMMLNEDPNSTEETTAQTDNTTKEMDPTTINSSNDDSNINNITKSEETTENPNTDKTEETTFDPEPTQTNEETIKENGETIEENEETNTEKETDTTETLHQIDSIKSVEYRREEGNEPATNTEENTETPSIQDEVKTNTEKETATTESFEQTNSISTEPDVEKNEDEVNRLTSSAKEETEIEYIRDEKTTNAEEEIVTTKSPHPIKSTPIEPGEKKEEESSTIESGESMIPENSGQTRIDEEEFFISCMKKCIKYLKRIILL